MTWHQWHQTAERSRRTRRFSACARAKAASDQSTQDTAEGPEAEAPVTAARKRRTARLKAFLMNDFSPKDVRELRPPGFLPAIGCRPGPGVCRNPRRWYSFRSCPASPTRPGLSGGTRNESLAQELHRASGMILAAGTLGGAGRPKPAAKPAAAPAPAAAAGAREGHHRRRHHRVPARQRPPGPALPRPVASRRSRSTSRTSSARATRATARPAWRTCSSTCSSRARRSIPNIPQELTAHGARPNGTTWFDRTNYFETLPGHRREPGLGARARSRPDGQLVHRARRTSTAR